MLQKEWRLSSTGVSPFLFPHYVPCLHISRSLINEWCCMDSQTAARLIFRNNWKRNVNLCQEFQINFRILGFMCQNNGPLLFPRISMTHSSLSSITSCTLRCQRELNCLCTPHLYTSIWLFLLRPPLLLHVLLLFAILIVLTICLVYCIYVNLCRWLLLFLHFTCNAMSVWICHVFVPSGKCTCHSTTNEIGVLSSFCSFLFFHSWK